MTVGTLTPRSAAVREMPRRLMTRPLWYSVLLLFAVLLAAARPESATDWLGAGAICVVSLIPTVIWAYRADGTIPLFPVYALTFLSAYALPLISGNRLLLDYTPDERIKAAMLVTAYVLVGTIVWAIVTLRKRKPRVRIVRTLPADSGDTLMLGALAAFVLFNFNLAAGGLQFSPGMFAIVRAVVLGLSAVAIFVLSVRFGAGQLTPRRSRLFLLLLVGACIVNAVSLFLVGSMIAFLLGIIGYAIGRRRLPWKLIAATMMIFAVLHAGKGEMRALYWSGLKDATIRPWQLPAFFGEWMQYGIESWQEIGSDRSESTRAMFDRAGLMHLFLMVQRESPRPITYLRGETYRIIPALLVPRILNPSKIAGHEGTFILNIHYELQTREDTLTTTIGWGLLNESLANFGFAGCIGLAVIVGVFYGMVSRIAAGTPILSLRSLFAVLVLSMAVQTEFTAGVYVSSLVQSSVGLVPLAILFMRRVRIPAST